MASNTCSIDEGIKTQIDEEITPLTHDKDEEKKEMSPTNQDITNASNQHDNDGVKDKKQKTSKTCCNVDCYRPGCCPILHPFGPFKILWDLLVTIAIVISCIEIPLTMSFEIPVDFSTSIGIMSFCIDIFLCCDISVSFRTAYFDKWDELRLIVNPHLIAKTYAKGWFVFDLVTSLPLGFMFGDSGTEGVDVGTRAVKFLRIIRLFRLLRIFRIYKMMGIIKVMNRLFPNFKKWIGIFQVMIFMLFCSHYFACLWYAIGKEARRDGDYTWLDEAGIVPGEVTIWEAYSTSLYWSVVTLFTTGYGDITAQNTDEQWAAMFVIVSGSIMTAYLIGTLTSLVTEGDRKHQLREEKIEEAYLFSEHFGLSNTLLRAITSHIRYDFSYNYVVGDAHDFLESLPGHLKLRAQKELATRAARNIDIFKGFDDAIIGEIVIKLKHIGCNAGYTLFSKGEWSTEVYALRVGTAKLYYSDKNKKPRILKRGDLVGEECIYETKRKNTLKCKSWCEFYVLKLDDLKEAIFNGMLEDKAVKEWERLKQNIKNNPIHRKLAVEETSKLKKARKKAKLEKHDTVMQLSHEGMQKQSNLVFGKTIAKDIKYEEKNNKSGRSDYYSKDVESDSSDSNMYQDYSVSDREEDMNAHFVEKLREYNRADSGLRDFKMKQHNLKVDKEDKKYYNKKKKKQQKNDKNKQIKSKYNTTKGSLSVDNIDDMQSNDINNQELFPKINIPSIKEENEDNEQISVQLTKYPMQPLHEQVNQTQKQEG